MLHVFCNQESKCVEENCWGSNCKVTENEHFFIMLLCWISSSNGTKMYSDTYSLQILSLNSSYAIIED